MTAPLSNAEHWDDLDVPVLTDLAPEPAPVSTSTPSAKPASQLVMDELPLLELDIPLDFQLYSADQSSRDEAPLPFDDLPVLGDEPLSPATAQAGSEAAPFIKSTEPAWMRPVIESPRAAEPVSPVVQEPAAVMPEATESVATVLEAAPSPVASQSAPQPITQSIPIDALPRNVLGGGLAALDNTDMLASIEKRLAALRAATGIGPGGVELKSSEPVVQPEVASAEPGLAIEPVVTESLPEAVESAPAVADLAVAEPMATFEAESAELLAAAEAADFDLSALPFESTAPEAVEAVHDEPPAIDWTEPAGTAAVDAVVEEANEVAQPLAAETVEPAYVEPVALVAVPQPTPVMAVPLVAASPADTAGKPVAVVGESELIESLYQMIMPRMKAELSLWLQDAIKMQNEQLLEGVMRQLKTDYDMMFGETLRESLRQAVADVSRSSQREQG